MDLKADTRWGKEYAEAVKANKLLCDRMVELIQKQIDVKVAQLTDSSDMGKPEWAVRTAERVGEVNALKFLRALYTVSDKDER
jgi:hypothetical protein